jgi:hypothetical protein
MTICCISRLQGNIVFFALPEGIALRLYFPLLMPDLYAIADGNGAGKTPASDRQSIRQKDECNKYGKQPGRKKCV